MAAIINSSIRHGSVVREIESPTQTGESITLLCVARWHSGRVPDLWSIGRGFESQPLHCRVQPWASFQHTCASVTKQYNLVPANGWWCLVSGKVTTGLASHWPRITDISSSPPMGSRPGRGRWAPPMLSCGAWLTLPRWPRSDPHWYQGQLPKHEKWHPAKAASNCYRKVIPYFKFSNC